MTLTEKRPEWAKALIVAEHEKDASDMMTDYFNTTTDRVIALAWSRHTRDRFDEMRAAAARIPETAHLGPGCDLFVVGVVLADDVVTGGSAYWKGGQSHWHSGLYPEDQPNARYYGAWFSTLADAEAFITSAGAPEPISFQVEGGTQLVHFVWKIERKSIEHREKYSMGHGYYLKASSRYSTGWTVRKVGLWYLDHNSKEIEDRIAASRPRPVLRASASSVSGTSGIEVRLNREKNGVEIKFDAKPSTETLARLKANGWRWSRFGSLCTTGTRQRTARSRPRSHSFRRLRKRPWQRSIGEQRWIGES